MALTLSHKVNHGVRLKNLDSEKTLDVIVKSIDKQNLVVGLVIKGHESTKCREVRLIRNSPSIDLDYFSGFNIIIGDRQTSGNQIRLIYKLAPNINAIRSNYSSNNDFLGYDVIKFQLR